MPRKPKASPASACDPVDAVRRFNRFYTRQIGVLQEHLLDSAFSLTELRVLYELGHGARVTAGALGDELGLDRGYVSRILKRFGKNGWIQMSRSSADRRRVDLSLTGKGRKVFAPLDRRSSREVRNMLSSLPSPQQQHVLAAMRTIESALGGSASAASPPYTLRPPQAGDMGWIVHRHGVLYAQEHGYVAGFEALVARIVADFVERLDPSRERCWIAEKDGEIVGSVFLVRKTNAVAKLRLLLVEPQARGLGIGRRLVGECVNFARESGYKRVVLWTQSELGSARKVYEGAGFVLIEQTPHQSWGRTDLVSETWELTL